MKKVCLILMLLFVSVITTACINNFAIQELNNKAKLYLEKGQTQQAISRLNASLDLDDSVFETHYNLAVAYMKNQQFDLAQKSFEKARKLKSDFNEINYSMAVNQEEWGNYIIEKINKNDKNDIMKKKKEIEKLYNEAINNYELFLKNDKDNVDRTKIESRVLGLKNQLKQGIATTEVIE